MCVLTSGRSVGLDRRAGRFERVARKRARCQETIDVIPDATMQYDTLCNIAKAKVKAHLFDEYRLTVQCNTKLVVHVKPVCGVTCKVPCKPNEIRLWPFTPQVLIVAPDGPAAPPHSADLGVVFHYPKKGDVRAVLLPKTVLAKKGDTLKDEDKEVVPFWLVRSTHDAGSANMETHNVKFDLKFMSDDLELRHTITIPTLRNTRAIKAGDELRYFKPDTTKAIQPKIQETADAKAKATAKPKAQGAKRQRTS